MRRGGRPCDDRENRTITGGELLRPAAAGDAACRAPAADRRRHRRLVPHAIARGIAESHRSTARVHPRRSSGSGPLGATHFEEIAEVGRRLDPEDDTDALRARVGDRPLVAELAIDREMPLNP